MSWTYLNLVYVSHVTPTFAPHSPTSWIGLMCLLPPLELLDFLDAELLRRRRSFFAFSSAISWRISDPFSTTISHNIEGEAGDLLECGVVGGVQSCSSKTSGNSSSSEMMKELDWCSSSLEFEDSEVRRGHDGYAHEGVCCLEREEDGISIGAIE
jgi:hypothetical protein